MKIFGWIASPKFVSVLYEKVNESTAGGGTGLNELAGEQQLSVAPQHSLFLDPLPALWHCFDESAKFARSEVRSVSPN
jgi:hypothetical protein